MAITLRRQLTDAEKDRVIEQHGRECFATGHIIPEGDSVHFDHIRAFTSGGETEINNIAPMCPQHNQSKGRLPLFDYRTKLRLDEFFKTGDRLTLGHLLKHLQEQDVISQYGLSVDIQESGDTIRVESATITKDYQAYQCPVTGWTYFYATLPIELIGSDDESDQSIGLQPRYLIPEKVFELFRHFQRHPILQPSLGRIIGNRIKLFDGQHKAAAILWNEHKNLECKIYLEPDIRLLNDTNISAHDKFAQTRFFSSIMVLKLGTQFGIDFENYKNLENGQIKSEAGFIEHLRAKDDLTKGEVNQRFRSFLYNSILEDSDNRLARLVSVGNRPTDEKPLTQFSLSNSLFASFLYREPVEDNMVTDTYKRGMEIKNMVKLMNMFDDLGLHQWNPKAPVNDEGKRKLARIVRSTFMKAWAELLKDSICAALKIFDSDEKTRPLYRSFNEQDLTDIKTVVARLIDWKIWSSPVASEIDQIRLDNDKAVRDWLKEKGLTTGYLMGAPE